MINKLVRTTFVTVAMLSATAPSWAEPPDSQGLLRERDASREQLRQEQIDRANRELSDRERTERDATIRLNNQSLERAMQPAPVLPGTAPHLTGTIQPGVTDRAGEMMRQDAARRDQLEYDRAVRGREDAERAVGSGSTIGLPGAWKPIGAR
jgi:hypothetical protein